MNAEPDRELMVFSVARRLAAGQRAVFLEEACAGDAGLRQRVEELLQAGEDAGDFLEDSAQGVAAFTLGANLPGSGAAAEFASAPAEKSGDRIGRYKLLEQIGEGGCGVVYMAEQESPVRRKVALKVIKLGMDTKHVIARFEAERQALALMDHPNIAKVLDAGATTNGRPYFVMELVRGTKITEYCDANHFSARQRLDLFVQVCRAVQHAHQKGIIHRDLKPSNILVTLHDGEPTPKVIDFGIAKATGGLRLTEHTVFTAFEQFLGTPAYMSPEQAQLTSQDIDTRSDIYSLGVLLYELLTGKTPFETKSLMQQGLDEMLRTIREKEPVRPSTRLATLLHAELTTTARQRQTEPPKLVQLVRGDLDWIVMKCLEKNPTRRYATANGLAVDLQRHLNNEVVVARPPSNLYRVQRFVGRNKLIMASVCGVIAALLIGLGCSTWLLFEEKVARRRAIAAEHAAEQAQAGAQTEAAKNLQVARFLKDILESVGASIALGRDTEKLRDVLDRTAGRVGQDLTHQPEVEAELRSIMGSTYLKLRESEKAEAMEREALRLRRSVFGETNKLVAESLTRLARALVNAGRTNNLSEAEHLARRALAVWQQLPERQPIDEALSLYVLGSALQRQRKWNEAEQAHREALEIRRRELHEHPDVASSLHNLAGVLRGLGRRDEAEVLLREGLAMNQKLLGRDHPDVLTFLNSLSGLLNAGGKSAEAEPLAREALALRRELFGNEHILVARAIANLASVLGSVGKPAEAEPLFHEALAMRRKLQGSESLDVAWSLASLTSFLSKQDRWAEAEPHLRELLSIRRKLFGNENPQVDDAIHLLALALARQGKFAEAEPLARECLVAREKRIPDHWQTFTTRSLLGAVLLGQGKHTEAERLLLEAWRGMERHAARKPEGGEANRRETAQHLAQLYEATGQSTQAAEWKEKLTKAKE